MNAAPLVLITRSESAGKALTEQVRARGLDAVHCAPFTLEGPERPRKVASNLRMLLPADRVIVTSQEGIRRAVDLAGAERFSRALVIVPGEGTARLARELGVENVVYPSGQGTSEAMLSLPELEDVDGLDILVLAAEGGRGLMDQTLTKRGASVDRIHVYRRIPQALPTGLEEGISRAGTMIVLAASWEGVSGLCERLSDTALRKLQTGILVAPSRRVADKAQDVGFARTKVAAGAHDEAMLAKLEQVSGN